MEPVTTAAVVTAGLNAASQGFNAAMQGSMNRKTREWNEKMYQMQRQHSLQDWTMQNEYNSPAAQMQRLKMAGLNPNLVYGKGADNVSGAVRSADVKGWNPQAPEFNLGSTMGQYYDVRMKNAQIDNLKAQNTAIVNDAILKSIQALNLGEDIKGKQINNKYLENLKLSQLSMMDQNIRKIQTDVDVSLAANERAEIQTATNVQEAVERILNSRAQRSKTEVEKDYYRQQIQNLRKDNELKQLDINLKKIGVQPGDNILIRAAGQYLKDFKNPIQSGVDWIKNKWKNITK
jgi:hypothetical protein